MATFHDCLIGTNINGMQLPDHHSSPKESGEKHTDDHLLEINLPGISRRGIVQQLGSCIFLLFPMKVAGAPAHSSWGKYCLLGKCLKKYVNRKSNISLLCYILLYKVSQKFVPLISCTITFDQNFMFT